MMLGLFFDNYTYRDENYKINFKDNIVKSYQSLYFDILSNFNFEIKSKKNLFNLDMSYKNIFENFYVNKIENKYYLFHIDERWDTFSDDIYQKTILLLNYIAKKNKVIITTGIKDFSFLHDLEKKIISYEYINGEFFKKDIDNLNTDIIILKNMPLNLLAYFIKNSYLNFSAHSGPIVHIGSAFNKQIIDVIKKDKNNELDRWIPIICNYRRINFENLNDDFIEKYNF